MQWRAAVGVLNVRLLALADQFLDLGDVAARSRIMQTGVDAQFPLARRRLPDGGERAEEQNNHRDGQAGSDAI
jgi:hypothetical protein